MWEEGVREGVGVRVREGVGGGGKGGCVWAGMARRPEE